MKKTALLVAAGAALSLPATSFADGQTLTVKEAREAAVKAATAKCTKVYDTCDRVGVNRCRTRNELKVVCNAVIEGASVRGTGPCRFQVTVSAPEGDSRLNVNIVPLACQR